MLFTKNITVESGNCSNFVAPGGDALDFRSKKRCIIKSDDNLDETEIDNYLDILSSIQLIEYTNEKLDYISGYIVKNICKKVVCPYCIDLLVKSDLTDHSYVKDANFTSFVNRGKLKIVSSGVSLIIQELEKSFQAVVVINKKLHNNVKQNIVMLAKKNILNKSTLFFSQIHILLLFILVPQVMSIASLLH